METKEQKINKMEKTTSKRQSKQLQEFVTYNSEILYYSLLEKLFPKEYSDYYFFDNHKHVMYIDKQVDRYNFYIQIDFYEEIKYINEDGDTIVNYQQLKDKLQCFFYKSETDEFIQITENEYNNYIELNKRTYSKIKNSKRKKIKNHVSYTIETDTGIPINKRIYNK